jgi:hypothetical protein
MAEGWKRSIMKRIMGSRQVERIKSIVRLAGSGMWDVIEMG